MVLFIFVTVDRVVKQTLPLFAAVEYESSGNMCGFWPYIAMVYLQGSYFIPSAIAQVGILIIQTY